VTTGAKPPFRAARRCTGCTGHEPSAKADITFSEPRLQSPGDGCRDGFRGAGRPARIEKKEAAVCRNIKQLYNFDPPATDDEIRAASLQFVRKLTGFNKPSQANEAAFNRAVDDVTAAARVLLESLTTSAQPKDRDVEAAKLQERSRLRFSRG
jgi:hypothetical protein